MDRDAHLEALRTSGLTIVHPDGGRETIERRIEGAQAVGDHRTSMLQDLQAGRELELAGLVGSVLELAELTGTPAPSTIC